MPTLEGFALDNERCFLGRDEAIKQGLIDLGDQFRIFVTATGRINAAKGMVVRVDDLVFHQDEKGWLLLVICHRGDDPFCVTRTHVWIDRRLRGAYNMR